MKTFNDVESVASQTHHEGLTGAATHTSNGLSSSDSNATTASLDGATPSTAPRSGSREHLWHRVNSELRRGCYKSVLCKNYSAAGTCPYLARCVFAHGPSELRIASQNFAEGLTSMEAIDRHIHRNATFMTYAPSPIVQSTPMAAAMPMPIPYGAMCMLPSPLSPPMYVVPHYYAAAASAPAATAIAQDFAGDDFARGWWPSTPPQAPPSTVAWSAGVIGESRGHAASPSESPSLPQDAMWTPW